MKILKNIFRFIFLLGFLELCGCATMFSKNQDEITIKSNPEGAEVFMNAIKIGETPFTFILKRQTFEQPFVLLKKEGYESFRLNFEKIIDKSAILNFGFFLTTSGATSWGVDALSGAMLQYSPSGYYIELKRKDERAEFNLRSRLSKGQFAALSEQELKRDIAKGDGEYLKIYYNLGFAQIEYTKFLVLIVSKKESLLNATDGVELNFKICTLFGV